MRDYVAWHRAYEDPTSDLSWRLRHVQRYIREFLDHRPGPLRVLSSCSGDGRDVLEVLAERDDAERIEAILVELHPEIAEHARATAAVAALGKVTVRTADAGLTDSYRDATPADLVILVGVLGNITDADLERTVATAPQLCRPGGTLIWSRGRDHDDRDHTVRQWFTEAGFTELGHLTRETGTRPALGLMRYDGAPHVLESGRRLFTFWR